MSTPEEPLRFLIRLIHVEKILPPLPGVHDMLLADLLKIDTTLLLQVRTQLAAEVREAAEELLGEASFAKAIDDLPFSAGSTIVGLGDSITDDLQSWIEILRQVLQLHRANDQIRIVNAGASGETTTQIMFRVPPTLALHPEWVICLAGVNDARRFGGVTEPTQVSPAETRRNLAGFRDHAARHGKARWLWVTPVPVIEQRITGHWFWTPMATHWVGSDVHAIGEAMLGLGGAGVDLRPVFGGQDGAQLILDDGVHPTLEGQKKILREIVSKLAAG